jgi:sulfotransferase family protein
VETRSRGVPTVSNDKVKVLYVAGLGRSGSTLLGNVLGQVDGFVSVGELRSIWEHGLLLNKVCGCGAPFEECGMWQPVLDEAFGDMSRVDPRRMIHLRESWTRTKHIPLMLFPPGRWLVKRHLAEYLAILDRLYRAVQTATGSRVIVDTSKFPSYGFALGMVPSIDLHVVHLVRDPRAVAYSWLRRRLHPDPESPEYMPLRSPAASSLRWIARNLATEAFWRSSPKRYLILRYEDFVAEMQATIARVLELVREEPISLPHVAEHEVKLGTNHNIWGNPSRLQTGTVEIRPDREWVSRVKPGDRRLVTSLTFPLLIRYGYPLGAGEQGSTNGGDAGRDTQTSAPEGRSGRTKSS